MSVGYASGLEIGLILVLFQDFDWICGKLIVRVGLGLGFLIFSIFSAELFNLRAHNIGV